MAAEKIEMSKVDFSETETRILGYKFGRYSVDSIDAEVLKQGIFEGRYDVVRVRTPAEDEYAVKKLSSIGVPYYFSGGVRRYKVNCVEAPLPPFTNDDISFELFTGQRPELLESIMLDTWGAYPLGYFKTPVLCDLITKEAESKALFDYYARFNNNTAYPDNYLWFMKKGQEYVGFIALNVYRERDMIDSTIAGVIKPYRNAGLFPNILRHIRLFCRQNKLTYFCCGARNENLYSQWAFEKDYMKGIGVEYIFHLVPMLGGG